MSTLRIVIVSAEKELYSGEAEYVSCPGADGDLGVLPRHAPLMTTLRPGLIEIREPGTAEAKNFFVSGGILEIQPDQVMVLADVAMRGGDLDEERAEKARKDAEERLLAQTTGLDYAAAEAELAEAMAQIQAIRKLRRG